MSKLIKAEYAPIIEVKKILPRINETNSSVGENAPFCPFSVEEEMCEQDPAAESNIEDAIEEGRDESEASSTSQQEEPQYLAEKILEEARDEARRLRDEAEKFLENAKRKAEEIESQAYNNGFEQGKKDGEELGKRQFDAMSNRLRSLIESLSTQGQELYAKYEAQMVKLCMKIAQKMVAVELKMRPELILEIIRRAAGELHEATEMTVFLHPKDLEIVKESMRNGTDLTGGHKVEFLSKDGIERGGCIIETEFGLVDATLEARWEAIEEALEKALAKEVGQ